jgi:glyoxylase-like metal-dependent hydrolase (beta-lactamase superfamily II)
MDRPGRNFEDPFTIAGGPFEAGLMPSSIFHHNLRTILPLNLACVFCLAVSCFSTASDTELTKLAEGVYVSVVSPDSNAVSNSGVVVLGRSVLVFDTHFTPEAGQALHSKIQTVSSKPVRFLVNSHFHSDHTHGNQAFPRVHTIIASTNGRRDIQQKDMPSMSRTVATAQSQLERLRKDAAAEKDAGQREALLRQAAARKSFLDQLSRLKILPPTMTFDESLVIQDGTREVRLLFLGIAHTEGDIVLLLPAEKIAFVGDLFFNSAFPSCQDANLLSWMKTLEEVLKLDAESFVPGHGQVGNKQDVRAFLNYLEDLRSMVEPAVTRGDSLEQLLRETSIPEKYSSYRFPNFFPANLQKMYAELRALMLASASAPEGDRKPAPEKPQP